MRDWYNYSPDNMDNEITEALSQIADEISWDNWRVEEVDGERNSSSSNEYWKVCEVLHCRLEWLSEHLQEVAKLKGDQEDTDEHQDTITMVQKLLDAVSNLES